MAISLENFFDKVKSFFKDLWNTIRGLFGRKKTPSPQKRASVDSSQAPLKEKEPKETPVSNAAQPEKEKRSPAFQQQVALILKKIEALEALFATSKSLLWEGPRDQLMRSQKELKDELALAQDDAQLERIESRVKKITEAIDFDLSARACWDKASDTKDEADELELVDVQNAIDASMQKLAKQLAYPLRTSENIDNIKQYKKDLNTEIEKLEKEISRVTAQKKASPPAPVLTQEEQGSLALEKILNDQATTSEEEALAVIFLLTRTRAFHDALGEEDSLDKVKLREAIANVEKASIKDSNTPVFQHFAWLKRTINELHDNMTALYTYVQNRNALRNQAEENIEAAEHFIEQHGLSRDWTSYEVFDGTRVSLFHCIDELKKARKIRMGRGNRAFSEFEAAVGNLSATLERAKQEILNDELYVAFIECGQRANAIEKEANTLGIQNALEFSIRALDQSLISYRQSGNDHNLKQLKDTIKRVNEERERLESKIKPIKEKKEAEERALQKDKEEHPGKYIDDFDFSAFLTDPPPPATVTPPAGLAPASGDVQTEEPAPTSDEGTKKHSSKRS